MVVALAVAIPAVALYVVWAQARAFLPFIADDSLISLRYSARLATGHGLTWTDGVRVEGYSNLLWILLCAVGGRLGFDLIATARALGVGCVGAALAALVYAHPPRSLASAVGAAVGTAALALSAPVAVWAIGGLEAPLVAALLAWTLTLTAPLVAHSPVEPRQAIAPGLVMGLLCWTRPDGALLAGAVVMVVVIAIVRTPQLRRPFTKSLRPLLVLAGGPTLFVVAQEIFRIVYYDDVVPNTAYAKLAWTRDHLRDGIQYLSEARPLIPLGLLAIAGLVAALLDAQRRRRALLLGVPLLSWMAYVLLVGGDIFPAHRMLVPAVVLGAFLAALGCETLASRARLLAPVVAVAAAVVLVRFHRTQANDATVGYARTERWEWDGQVVGHLLATAFGRAQPLLAVDAAGSLPYFSGLPSLDMLGLNDRYLAHHPPTDFGHGRLGHELGNGPYVLSRRPDIVIFCAPTGSDHPCFASGKQMVTDPSFASLYEAINVLGVNPNPVRARVYVRREDGPLGTVRTADRIDVPGYLFATSATSVAQLDAQGALATTITPSAPGMIDGLLVPSGRWQATVAGAARRAVRVTLRAAAPATATGRVLAVPSGEQALVQIEVGARPGLRGFYLEHVTLTRIGDAP
jgi:hypothetical protein